MEIDGYVLFHTTDPLADVLPLPPVETANYINGLKNWCANFIADIKTCRAKSACLWRGQYSVAYNIISQSGRIPTGHFPERDMGLFALTQESNLSKKHMVKMKQKGKNNLQMHPWLKLAQYAYTHDNLKFIKCHAYLN